TLRGASRGAPLLPPRRPRSPPRSSPRSRSSTGRRTTRRSTPRRGARRAPYISDGILKSRLHLRRSIAYSAHRRRWVQPPSEREPDKHWTELAKEAQTGRCCEGGGGVA